MNYNKEKLSLPPLPFFLLMIILFVFFVPLISGLKLLDGGDLVNNYIPYKYFWRYWLKQGVFPLWNPLIFCGRPFVADIQLGCFYPPNLLHLIIPPEQAFTILTILHLLMALWGAFLFFYRALKVAPASATLSAIIFVFNGFFLTRLYSGNVLFIFTSAWTPWIFWGFIHWLTTQNLRYAVLTAILMAFQLLAGAPQLALISNSALICLLVIFILLNRKQLLSVPVRFALFLANSLLIFLLALGLCAIQLFPTYEFMHYSFERAGKTAWEYATIDSLRPRFILTWFFPDIFFTPTRPEFYWGGTEGYWEINAYISIPAIILVICFLFNLLLAQRKRISFFPPADIFSLNRVLLVTAFVLLVMGIALALGRYSPVYYLTYHLFPFINKFRVPARWIFLYILSLSILTAISLDLLLKKTETFVSLLRRTGVFVLLFLIGVALILFLTLPMLLNQLGLQRNFSSLPPDLAEEYTGWCFQRAKLSLFSSFAFALLTGFCIIFFSWRRLRPDTFVIVIGLIIIFDIYLFGMKFISATPAKIYLKQAYPSTPLISFLQQYLGEYQYRFLALDDVYYWQNDQNQMEVYPNRAMLRNLPDVRGYDPVYIRSFGEFMNMLAGRPIDKSPGALLFVKDITNPVLLQMLNVRVILSYRELNHSSLRLRQRAVFGLNIYELLYPRGEAFIATAKRFTGDTNQLLEKLCTIENTITVFTSDAPPAFNISLSSDLPEKNSVRRLAFSPNKQVYEVNLREGNILVFSENYYPGWHVLVDNQSVPVIRVNHTFFGVFLAPGRHMVTKYFYPTSLKIGFFLSLLSLLILVLLFFRKQYGITYDK
ncbi:MAG: YfhO family protein [Candidatus Sumerlaeia bacterium]|nr:YfhO family protein [Candidatus Sumerlaeia bacterium]